MDIQADPIGNNTEKHHCCNIGEVNRYRYINNAQDC